MERSTVKFGMLNDRECLKDVWRKCAAQLDVTALLRMGQEAEAGEDTQQFFTGQSSQPGH